MPSFPNRSGLSNILFSLKCQMVIILGFTGHEVSDAVTQLCQYCMKAAIDNMNGY